MREVGMFECIIAVPSSKINNQCLLFTRKTSHQESETSHSRTKFARKKNFRKCMISGFEARALSSLGRVTTLPFLMLAKVSETKFIYLSGSDVLDYLLLSMLN